LKWFVARNLMRKALEKQVSLSVGGIREK